MFLINFISILLVYVVILMCQHASDAFTQESFAVTVARPKLTSLAVATKTNSAAAAQAADGGDNKRNKNPTTKWIACSSTKEMNRAISEYIQEGDIVAELGSQLRESSTSLCEAVGPSGYAVLVDIERKSPNEKKGQDRTSAMRRNGDEVDFYTDRSTFVETKSFEFWRHALFFQHDVKEGYNALVVDMSTVAGNDLELTCISLVKEFISLNAGSGEYDNPCRVVIVKSKSLHNLARRLHHAQRIISGSQPIIEERGTSIIAAVGVEQYRQTIPFVVRKGDVCVEVGCHLGTSTVLIDEAACQHGKRTDADKKITAGGCVGLDIGPSIIRSAQKKYPLTFFEVGNGFKTGEISRLTKKHLSKLDSSRMLDIIYVDIGGLSGPEGLLEAVSLLSSITNALEPRCIVIKSLCVRRLASSIVPFSDIWREMKLMQNAVS
ncbi:hypothetical protein ACHAWT_010446 [Skeletonema menzelii]